MAVPTDRQSARQPPWPGRVGRPGRGQAVAWPPARLWLECLECRERLPGYGRTGTPVNDVEDYRLVVD